MNYTIREFVESDAESVSEMLRESFEWFHKGDHESWLWKSFAPSNLINFSKTQDILVAVDDKGEIVGYISSTTTLYGVAYVPTVAVRNSLRRMGIGKLLLDEKIRRFREQGIRKMWLLVTHINTSAIEFYRKNDFVIEGYLRDHTGPGYDEVLLSRFL